MILAYFIKDVRQQLTMSQEQLAKALNVSFSTINRWENGKATPSNLAQKMFFDFCEGNLIEIPAELRNASVK
jgi:transcriptional regulator with XRE-family HTH domain